MTLLQEAAGSLSSSRLSAFRFAADEANEVVLGRYLWNVALAEALYPTIHFLEVELRNALHGAIAMLAGPEWYELPTVVVDERARKEIADARVRIAQRGHVPDGPRIIAALDLGFWTGLCNREYEQGLNTPAGQIPLWPALFHHVGAALPHGLRTRAALSEYLGRVRLIRNRASHHEPLWLGERDRRGHRVPLSVDQAQMQDLARSLNPNPPFLRDSSPIGGSRRSSMSIAASRSSERSSRGHPGRTERIARQRTRALTPGRDA